MRAPEADILEFYSLEKINCAASPPVSILSVVQPGKRVHNFVT